MTVEASPQPPKRSYILGILGSIFGVGGAIGVTVATAVPENFPTVLTIPVETFDGHVVNFEISDLLAYSIFAMVFGWALARAGGWK